MTATQPAYLSISRRTLDVEDYMDVARRHLGWIIGPMFAGLVVAIVVAYLLPNTYESRATMQITPAQVSEALVPSTINQQLAERVVQMEGAILSRTSLSNLIQSPNLDLYPNERKKKPIDDVIEDMKHDLRVDVNIQPGGTGRHASSFSIAFLYPNRVKAQATVNALISRFNEENQNAQGTQQRILKDLFGDEVTASRASLTRASENLTKFRMANQGRLPEQSSLNIQALTSVQMQMQGMDESLNRIAQMRVQYETSLQSVKSQMEFARSIAQESTSSGGYSSPAARQNEDLLSINRQIDNEELRLQQFLQHFKENYPDVVDLRRAISVLKTRRDQLLEQQEKQQAAAEETAAQTKAAPKKLPPQMLASIASYQEKIDQLTAQLKNLDTDRDYRTKERDKLAKELEIYRARLSPSGVDAQLQDLLREQATATENYQRALAKQQLAAQNGEMIQKRAGELLEVLDPASLPANPTKPQRGYIVGGGFVISIFLGIALAAVQEAKDTSLKNLKDVRAYTNLPVLGSIPLLENTMLVKRKRRITYLGWSAALIVGILAICGALFYYYSVTVNT